MIRQRAPKLPTDFTDYHIFSLVAGARFQKIEIDLLITSLSVPDRQSD
jgi:hypothetical protein